MVLKSIVCFVERFFSQIRPPVLHREKVKKDQDRAAWRKHVPLTATRGVLQSKG